MLGETSKKASFILNLTFQEFINISNWVNKELLEGKIYTVEDWLKISFYLQKERWSKDLDWLESQPITKILTMIEINKSNNERVKKLGKRK